MSELRITSTELGDAATSATGGQVRVTSYDGGNGIVQSIEAGTNVTVDSTDPAHPIVSATGGGGGGAVDSVNGQTGVVVLAASDVGADASGAAAAAQAAAIAASQPLDSDLTAIAALSTTTFGRALLALADAAALRTSAGLGTAAVAASTDFDAAGAAAAAQAASQPLDSDLTAIAALTTTSYGRAFLALADAAAGRTALGLGTAATSASTAFDASGAAAAAQAASQPLDSDLTAIAALTTTSYGRAFLALADAAAGRTALGLGTAATSASTDFQPIDSDLTAIAALSTTSFGRSFLALADAAAGRTLLGLGTLATQSGTFSGTSSGTNTGDQTVTLTGDVTGSGTGSFAATLAATAVTPGSYGDASHSLAATVDAKGRLTALAANSIAIPESAVTNLTTDLAAKAPLASPALTGSPTAPTQAASDNSTKVATTAYVDAGLATRVGQVGLRRAGGYYALGTASGNAATTANNTEQCIPFVISNSSVTADRISCEVTGAGNAGALIRLGIRADNGRGLPFSTVVLDAGTIAADTIGTKEITISQALTPGLYWATLTAQSAGTTAPTVRLCNLTAGSLAATGWTTSIAATNQVVSGYTQTGVSGALPSSFTLAGTNGAAGTPQIWMRFV